MELKPGYKQTLAGVIPEDWDLMPLAELGYWKGGATPSMQNPIYWSSGTVPWVSSGDVKSVLISDTPMKITESAVKETSATLLPANSIMIVTRSGILRKYLPVAMNTRPLAINQDIKALIPSSLALSGYLLHVLIGNGPRILATCLKSGTTVESIEFPWLKAFHVPLPPTTAEQEAIAETLSDTDDLIASLEQLIAKKRHLKQGAMQELLTGKKRLPGFSGKWEVTKIADISRVGRGRIISHREIRDSRNPQYPVYSSQTFNDGIMGYLDSYDFEGDYVTWTTDGVNAGKVFFRKGRFNCTNVCGTLLIIANNPEFVALALDRVAKSYVSTNLANPKLMNGVMKQIEIQLPPSVAEQTAIATILSGMDAEITALENKLAKARQIKQGMMHNLLTGRIRLI